MIIVINSALVLAVASYGQSILISLHLKEGTKIHPIPIMLIP